MLCLVSTQYSGSRDRLLWPGTKACRIEIRTIDIQYIDFVLYDCPSSHLRRYLNPVYNCILGICDIGCVWIKTVESV
jgi:hypothetical protein